MAGVFQVCGDLSQGPLGRKKMNEGCLEKKKKGRKRKRKEKRKKKHGEVSGAIVKLIAMSGSVGIPRSRDLSIAAKRMECIKRKEN